MRLWDDMPTDPKWRVIARRSGQRIGDVIAMFNILMVQAGANADERGRTHGNDDDDIGAALDLEPEDVAAIRDAMQGKVLDGTLLMGWEKRQPKREDGSATRAKAWRDAKREERERERTQANAEERPDSDSDADAEPPKGGSRGRVKLAEKPDGVDAQVWDDFKRLRDKKRAPLTETALKGIAREAAKVDGLTLNDALALCCERGWQGLKAEWVKEGNGGRNRNGSGWLNA